MSSLNTISLQKKLDQQNICGQLNQVKFPYPTVDGREVYVFSDPPHLMKCIRNRLYSTIVD